MIYEERYIKRCLQLATCGLGNVEPNPYVGAVVVHDDKIIGEGFHKQFGNFHAEVNAIDSVKDKCLLKKSTLYVNLEPCSHYGKTPPCAELIIKSQIPKVVVANLDPNPLVAGNGINMLKNAGIEVVTGVLENEAYWLNRRFFTYHSKKRPYIILKWAKTADNFIDINRKNNTQASNNHISNYQSDILVHKWRSEEAAILVGSNTIINDNPTLNVRNWFGKNPIRIIVSKSLHDFSKNNVSTTPQKTIFIQPFKNEIAANIEYIKIDLSLFTIENICKVLYKKNIISVLVEGGKTILEKFIESNIWDEARIISCNKNFGSGLSSPNLLNANLLDEYSNKNDLIQIFASPRT